MPNNLSPMLLVVACITILFLCFRAWHSSAPKPPQLSESIPFISNTIQYLTDAGRFIDRVTEKLASSRSNIVRFHVGLRPAYIVTGPKNVQTVLGSPELLDGNFLQLMLMDKHWGMTRAEIDKFARDKSGRGKTPVPGTAADVPDGDRYWLGHDRLYAEYLSSRRHADALAGSFQRLFAEQLDRRWQPTTTTTRGQWASVELSAVLREAMAESAVVSLFGSRVVELNPGLVARYWEFDHVAGRLAWGLPGFLQRRAVAARDRLHGMVRRHVDSAWACFDWDATPEDLAWEPHFGSRLSRETARWLRDKGFSNHAAAGHTLATLFGLNGNTVPITTWAMIELVRDPELLRAVREEIGTVCEVDPGTGARHIDAQRLVNLPLMQSLYVELLRTHVSFNVTRQATRPLAIEGYPIEKGALVQVCSRIEHYHKDVWGVEGHPASEFWAYRHVKYVDDVQVEGQGQEQGQVKGAKKAQFVMKGRPSSFLPFGGGYVMCPGRHFAKQEILLAIAVLVTKFDIEFIEWTGSNGLRSDTPPQDDQRYAGFVAMSPDRGVRVRWRRIY
ncbi:putative cytochrome P450 [Rosellinia necatrix]|uniref:Putative cytochrome P450 n=1 Tax=Rosellinia necatrix TaxID=77044 RepID=A0A1S7UP36_ROSNE|nr:putative cytochrome P450 [Rosellinia necatrix]